VRIATMLVSRLAAAQGTVRLSVTLTFPAGVSGGW
jgi:hypothetical protein